MSTVYIRFAIRALDLEPAPVLERAQRTGRMRDRASARQLGRAPMLERLLAHASASISRDDWRGEAFRAIASAETPVPPIGAAALCAAGGAAQGAWGCLATPVHLTAGMSNVMMAPQGILEVGDEAARALADDFKTVFGAAEMRLVAGAAGMLLGVFDQPLEVVTHDPEAVEGRDVFGFQPEGSDAAGLRRLMSEMEMWLFDHAVNRTRAAHSQPAITSLWLWGGGPVPKSMPAVQGWTAGRDPLFSTFESSTEFPRQAGAGVLVCSERVGSAEWLGVEERWFEPAWASLRSGRIDRIVLSAGNRRFTVRKGFSRRLWRPARPWREILGGTDENPSDTR